MQCDCRKRSVSFPIEVSFPPKFQNHVRWFESTEFQYNKCIQWNLSKVLLQWLVKNLNPIIFTKSHPGISLRPPPPMPRDKKIPQRNITTSTWVSQIQKQLKNTNASTTLRKRKGNSIYSIGQLRKAVQSEKQLKMVQPLNSTVDKSTRTCSVKIFISTMGQSCAAVKPAHSYNMPYFCSDAPVYHIVIF
jgi:hypothetical protein